MKGEQSTDDPLMGFWSGYGAAGRGQGSFGKGFEVVIYLSITSIWLSI